MLLQLAQVGGVGVIAAVAVWEMVVNRKEISRQNAEHQQQMAKRLATLEEALIQIVKNNTVALQNSANAIAEMNMQMSRRTCMLDRDEVREKLRRLSQDQTD